MSDKPGYIGILAAIATGEARGDRLLSAWAERTPDPGLAKVLRLAAARSREHAAAFARRLLELGVDYHETPSSEFEGQLSVARSSASDRDKFRRLLGYGDATAGEDPLLDLFADAAIDIETGTMLGRYIATERDSEARLREIYDALRPPHAHEGGGAALVDLDDIYAQLDKLTRTIEELKTLARK
jgi:hypothetical protein